MDANERQLIDTLFGKLRQVDGQAPARDAEAETLIRDHLAQLPAAPYYMAQAILTQEQALTLAQQRIQELERQRASQPAGGSFLSGLFVGGQRPQAPPSSSRRTSRAPTSNRHLARRWAPARGVPAVGQWRRRFPRRRGADRGRRGRRRPGGRGHQQPVQRTRRAGGHTLDGRGGQPAGHRPAAGLVRSAAACRRAPSRSRICRQWRLPGCELRRHSSDADFSGDGDFGSEDV